jgi:hypothetical protein
VYVGLKPNNAKSIDKIALNKKIDSLLHAGKAAPVVLLPNREW